LALGRCLVQWVAWLELSRSLSRARRRSRVFSSVISFFLGYKRYKLIKAGIES
jgi:hypothetical protein